MKREPFGACLVLFIRPWSPLHSHRIIWPKIKLVATRSSSNLTNQWQVHVLLPRSASSSIRLKEVYSCIRCYNVIGRSRSRPIKVKLVQDHALIGQHPHLLDNHVNQFFHRLVRPLGNGLAMSLAYHCVMFMKSWCLLLWIVLICFLERKFVRSHHRWE